ncbi:unnamed protein product, partial [Gulo gulo]
PEEDPERTRGGPGTGTEEVQNQGRSQSRCRAGPNSGKVQARFIPRGGPGTYSWEVQSQGNTQEGPYSGQRHVQMKERSDPGEAQLQVQERSRLVGDAGKGSGESRPR